MQTATPWPANEKFSQFLLGTLPPAEVESVASWMVANPEAAESLAALQVRDDFIDILVSAPHEGETSAEVERIIRIVTQSSQADSSLAAEFPRIAGFRFVRVLGRGGMGTVYEAEETGIGRRVAVKVMHPKYAAEDVYRQRFLREGKAAGVLDSDHVVPIHQVGEADGNPYLVMKYLEGATLEDWLESRARPVTTAELLRVAGDVLTGLAAVHDKGLVHRDIKPLNIWIDRATGRAILLDFGLTRGQDVGVSLTPSDTIVGTPTFISPEQAGGERVDARTDLFSLGVVLYRMVAGKSPFQRPTILGTLTALATESPPPLTGVEPEVSAFVARLMARDADDRFADAETALAEARSIEKRVAGRVSGPPRAPRLLIAAAFAAASVMAGVIVIIITNKEVKVEVMVSPGKEEQSAKGKGELGKAVRPRAKDEESGKGREVQVGARVTLKVSTAGYTDDTLGTLTNQIDGGVVPEGAKGKVIAVSNDGTLLQVRLHGPEGAKGVEVWLLKQTLEAE